MKCSWREGNKIQLLENGEQYYPAVFKAIGDCLLYTSDAADE